MNDDQSLVYRLKTRAEIRRQIPSRKSVQEGAPDRIADLLEEAATEIERLTIRLNHSNDIIKEMSAEFTNYTNDRDDI